MPPNHAWCPKIWIRPLGKERKQVCVSRSRAQQHGLQSGHVRLPRRTPGRSTVEPSRSVQRAGTFGICSAGWLDPGELQAQPGSWRHLSPAVRIADQCRRDGDDDGEDASHSAAWPALEHIPCSPGPVPLSLANPSPHHHPSRPSHRWPISC